MQNLNESPKPEKSCKKCNSSKSLKMVPKGMIIFTIYFLVAAVYGTIEIVKNIIALF